MISPLAPLGALYGGAMSLRNIGYDHGWLDVQRASVPVVSVGNLTVGGTGKTPLVVELTRRLQRRGLAVGVLSRGYGRVTDEPTLVSEGHGLLSDAAHGGDEPTLIAQLAPGALVLSDADRVRGARALTDLGARVIVLDDGFQHRRLGRDLDCVVIDSRSPLDAMRPLPAGRGREPLAGLRRAGLVALSHVGSATDVARFERTIRRHTDAPMVLTRHRPVGFRAADWSLQPPLALSGNRVLAFAGIANPAAFVRSLGELGVEVDRTQAFRDHHRYTPTDLAELAEAVHRHGLNGLVTTEKDLIRIVTDPALTAALSGVPLAALAIELELLSGDDVLDNALDRLLG